MRLVFARVRGAGFIMWQARHMAYHVMLGLLWAWFLRERWKEFNPVWVWTAALGSLLPDIDHLNYFFGYGRKESYTQKVFGFARKHQWRGLFLFLSTHHKKNTHLSYHNVYITALLAVVALGASLYDWRFGVVLFGAMVSHFLFDMTEDLFVLGSLNPNWRRWGRG